MSEVFKTLNKTIVINKIKIPCRITIKVEEDDIPFDGDDARDIKLHKTGKRFMGIVFVKAVAIGLENIDGFDSLGGCSLRPNNMFNPTPFETDVNTILKEYGMIKNAIADLKTSIKNQARQLKPFA